MSKQDEMKVLCIDIETTPNLAHVWSLWDQNIGLNQLLEPTEMLCFAAKWLGKSKVEFYSNHEHGHQVMVEQAHRLLDQADVAMGWNSRRFDVPYLNREFLEGGLKPPSPFRQIDLYSVVKRQFKFLSYKLDHVAKALGLSGKVKHEGHELWIKCMAGDEAAWRRMERYNKQDVLLLEQLYEKLQPWISAHPNRGLYQDGSEDVCPSCGSADLKPQGFAYLTTGKYQRWQCGDCGAWSRSTRRVASVEVTA